MRQDPAEPAGRLLYLSRADVERVAPDMATVVALVEDALREKAAGRAEMPPKPGIHPRPDAFIHAMPAYLPARQAAGLKWVSGYPTNAARGLPYITGLMVLNDVETGVPVAVMDATWVTGVRTGAATAVAARCLARPDSETVAILGCGVQGRTNLAALASIFRVTRVYAYDVSDAAARRFAGEMAERLGLDIVPVTAPRDAVVAADLVVTAGPILETPHATIRAGWLQPGAFASAVDFDSYWAPDALAEIDKIATDDHAQFAYYRELGYFRRTPTPYASLDELVTGAKPGRASDAERTLAINLGLAIEDLILARHLYERALASGVGTWLPL
jgi:ornithine cyclodeaminase/alanine dehydrogenase-like protein (mu-crystallin family)